MSTIIAVTENPSLAVLGSDLRFPVRRIYCVGRNYEDHAKEMGHSGREAPFFFMKPGDAVLPASGDLAATLPYPTLTHSLHHEIELVVAIGKGGTCIAADKVHEHIFGYAVGLDMTRRDLQNEAKKLGRPWCIAKGFDHSAPIGTLTPAHLAGDLAHAQIALRVNGVVRQSSLIAKMIWNVAETIEQLSRAWELQPGDLVFTGTPEGVGAVERGDLLEGSITGLTDIKVLVQ